MRAVSFFIARVTVGAAFGAAACGNGDDASSPPVATVVAEAGADASKSPDATTATDAAADDGTAIAPDAQGQAVLTTRALLRMANWSADSPAVDFCMAPHGTAAFQGPVLGTDAASIDDAGIDAGSGTLPFPQISAYLLVDPGQYDIRVVAGGAVDCSTGIVPDATNLPVLAPGGLETVALIGANNPQPGELPLKAVGFTDELKNTLVNALLIRVINADVDVPQVQVGELDMYFTPFTAPVGPGSSSAVVDPMADSNGYVPAIPFTGETIAARAVVTTLFDAGPQTLLATAQNISLANGLTVTFVVVGPSGQPGGGSAQLLECVDTAAGAALQGSCTAISK
jgi:hypothetical protein